MKLPAALLVLCLGMAEAQQPYTGGLLQQNFDTLPADGTFDFQDIGLTNIKGPFQLTAAPVNASGMTGWSIHARVGSPLQFKVENGSGTSAAAYSYGLPGVGDRALGSLGGSVHVANIGWRLVNNTGQTLTQFTLTFRGEQWRNGGSLNVNKLDFAYFITPTLSIDIDSTGSYTPVTALDFTSPVSATGAFALNGNAAANRTERSATLSGLNWPNGQMLILRWRDSDETGSDDGLAIDDAMFYAPTGTATLPAVVSLSPADGGTRVLTNATMVVTFNQPITATGTWFEITGSVSGPISATVTNAGPMRYTLTPATTFASGETVTVRVVASQVTNTSAQAMSTDFTSSFATQPSSATLTPIHAVQGNEGYSPLTGAAVTVQGVVVADFQGVAPALGGFFLQEQDATADADPATSEGIWIADRGSAAAVDLAVGDVVRVTGTVSESNGLTQINSLTAVARLGTGALPALTAIMLPASATTLERYEGMRVQFPQTLSVTGNSGASGITDNYARFGELTLCSDGPLNTPTEFIDPNDSPASGTTSTGRSNVPAIRAEETAQALRRILLDDASTADTPDPTPYLSTQGTRRVGDTVTGLTGILSYGNGSYRVQPVGTVLFVDTNPRPDTPPGVNGRLKVAAMNVLNYFVTFGGANDRGASDAAEFQRQKDKIIAALVGLNADVLGLMEIQDTPAALNDIVTALNAAIGGDGYAVVPDPATPVSGDVIRTVLLYRPSKISLFGPCYADTDAVWNTLRNPLAQVFIENSTSERFIVCLNHWKSKSSSGASGANVDQNDGQASYNDRRRQQASRILTWLQDLRATVGDNDVLLMGDLNSLGEEDPLDILRAGGYADQGQRFQPGDYSYRLGDTRGRLDHVFGTATMASQITAAAHWHINADEPAFYDYNLEGKTAPQQAINVGTPFRSSDHDPVLIGITLAPQPTTYAMWTAANNVTGAADADSDNDGIKNLLEFALAANPAIADFYLLPAVSTNGSVMTLDYRLRSNASGITVTPQWSEDLISWQNLTGSFVSTLNTTASHYRAMVDISGKPRVFMRLQATP